MAERYWPGEDPLGKRFHLGTRDQPWITVVGVVRRVRHNAVVEEPRAEMYIPHAQFGPAGGSAQRGMTIVVRAATDPLALVDGVRATVRGLDPNLPVSDVQTLERVADDSLSRPRFTAVLLGLFAALALVLATIGIYGVVSILVIRRRREIGVRMALGASRRSIVRMVVSRGLVLASIGLVIGLIGAAGMTRVLESLLYGVTQFDLLTFASAPVVLAMVALLACLIPAARASAVDPAIALRDD
jgi:putative ABC transport system permease protein